MGGLVFRAPLIKLSAAAIKLYFINTCHLSANPNPAEYGLLAVLLAIHSFSPPGPDCMPY